MKGGGGQLSNSLKKKILQVEIFIFFSENLELVTNMTNYHYSSHHSNAFLSSNKTKLIKKICNLKIYDSITEVIKKCLKMLIIQYRDFILYFCYCYFFSTQK